MPFVRALRNLYSITVINIDVLKTHAKKASVRGHPCVQKECGSAKEREDEKEAY